MSFLADAEIIIVRSNVQKPVSGIIASKDFRTCQVFSQHSASILSNLSKISRLLRLCHDKITEKS